MLKGPVHPKIKSAVLSCVWCDTLSHGLIWSQYSFLLWRSLSSRCNLSRAWRFGEWLFLWNVTLVTSIPHQCLIVHSTCDYVEFACARVTLCRLTCDYVEFTQVFHFVAFCIRNGNRQQSGLCIFDWWCNHMAQKTSLPLDTQLLTSNHEYTQVSDSGLSLRGGFKRGGSYHKVTRN